MTGGFCGVQEMKLDVRVWVSAEMERSRPKEAMPRKVRTVMDSVKVQYWDKILFLKEFLLIRCSAEVCD